MPRLLHLTKLLLQLRQLITQTCRQLKLQVLGSKAHLLIHLLNQIQQVLCRLSRQAVRTYTLLSFCQEGI